MDKIITKNVIINDKRYKAAITRIERFISVDGRCFTTYFVCFYNPSSLFTKAVVPEVPGIRIDVPEERNQSHDYSKAITLAANELIHIMRQIDNEKDREKNALSMLKKWDGIINTKGKEGTQDGDSD